MDNEKDARWFDNLTQACCFVEGMWRDDQLTTDAHPAVSEATVDFHIHYELDYDGLEEPATLQHLQSEVRHDWLIGLTPSFQQAIKNIDKKLQGRVLQAIAEISRHPLQLRGDTIKPLEGEWKGAWRYRIGDWRLIYRPEAKDGRLWLLDFKPRGGAYG